MIRPLNDRILVQRDKAETMVGSIIIPDSCQKKPLKGKVVAVGQGALKDGKRIPLTVKLGDTVIFSQHAGVDVKFGKIEYTLMKEEGVLGVLDG